MTDERDLLSPAQQERYDGISSVDELRAWFIADQDAFAKLALKIVPKQRGRGKIRLEASSGQQLLERRRAEQVAAGKPQRLIILKARQVGMSTWVQGLLIKHSTQTAYTNCTVVAHDTETGGKLYAIGDRMFRNLPPEIAPELRAHKRTRFLHFGQRGEAAWREGELWPDSTYWVDTAGEFEAGRGGTFHMLHASEYAFWPQPEQKYTALMQAVPEEPDTLVVFESTANGHNHFKELWDDAMEGRSEFAPVFWPWWKEPDYTRPFATPEERQEFAIGDTDQSPYAEEEPELVDPGPIDIETGEHCPLTLEQLNWRRFWIPNKLGGKIDKFHQEYPVSPEQAFLATGAKVFEPMLVAKAMRDAEHTDPRIGRGGPMRGQLVAGERPLQAGRFGPIEVPAEPTWKQARELLPGETADWRLWLPEENGKPVIPEDDLYVVGVDVSQGIPESEDELDEPAYHAIEVINHRTREQVAEYVSRCDPDELAEWAVLAAILFNDAWLGIEVTGPGLAAFRKAWLDFRYRFLYFRQTHDRRAEKKQDRMGWSTDKATKPVLLALGAELLREGTHGMKSRRLVSEFQTYIRLSTGKTVPEKGKFADRLMAYLIAQQVADETPLRVTKRKERPKVVRDPVTGARV